MKCWQNVIHLYRLWVYTALLLLSPVLTKGPNWAMTCFGQESGRELLDMSIFSFMESCLRSLDQTRHTEDNVDLVQRSSDNEPRPSETALVAKWVRVSSQIGGGWRSAGGGRGHICTWVLLHQINSGEQTETEFLCAWLKSWFGLSELPEFKFMFDVWQVCGRHWGVAS